MEKKFDPALVLVEDGLPFPDSKIYYYAFIYKNQNEFFQVSILSVFTPKKILCFFSCKHHFKKIKTKKKFNSRSFLQHCFLSASSVLVYTRVVFLITFFPRLDHFGYVKIIRETIVSYVGSVSSVSGPRHHGTRFVQAPKRWVITSTPRWDVRCFTGGNECPPGLSEVLASFGLNSEVIWQHIQQLGSPCFNPEKELKRPPDFLTPFLQPEQIENFSLQNITPQFITRFKSFLHDEHNRRYVKGYRNIGPVVNENGQVIITAQQRKDRQIKSALVYALLNEQQSIPLIENAFTQLGKDMYKLATGESTHQAYDVCAGDFQTEIGQLNNQIVPLLQHLEPDEQQLLPYIHFFKRCLGNHVPPTIIVGHFYQNQNAHVVGRDPEFGLNITANLGTISDWQHALVTEGEEKLGLLGARGDGGVPLAKTALGRINPVEQAFAERTRVILRDANKITSQSYVNKASNISFLEPGAPFTVQVLLDLLFEMPITDGLFVKFNKGAIRQVAGILGSFYGGPGGAILCQALNSNPTLDDFTYYYKGGRYFGRYIFPEIITNAYEKRVEALRVNEYVEGRIRHISQIEFYDDAIQDNL